MVELEPSQSDEMTQSPSQSGCGYIIYVFQTPYIARLRDTDIVQMGTHNRRR